MKDAFIKYLKFEKRLSQHTILSYSNDLNQFILFYKQYSSNQSIEKVDKRSIRSWIVELSLNSLSPRSINRKIATIRSFYKFLIKRDYIKKNPTASINSLKTDQTIPNFIKEKDIKILFQNLVVKKDYNGHRDKLILELLYGTGIRISELINLKINDIRKWDSMSNLDFIFELEKVFKIKFKTTELENATTIKFFINYLKKKKKI